MSSPADFSLDLPDTTEALIARMVELEARFQEAGDRRHYFLSVYRRTTEAIDGTIATGGFEDPPAFGRWTLVFARYYVDAITKATSGREPSEPWAACFKACRMPRLLPLRHVLLGMNAHINFDLPQSMCDMISDAEFDDPAVVGRWVREVERSNELLASRVEEEGDFLAGLQPKRRFDRVLRPIENWSTQRFLQEARRKAWANAFALSLARRQGPEAFQARRRELEVLSRQRVDQLIRAKSNTKLLVELGLRGFGVLLPGAPSFRFSDYRKQATASHS